LLYFVDESGIDLKEAPYLVLAGVSIAEAKVWPLAQAFNDLRSEILRFPPDSAYEVKGSKLLKTRVFKHSQLRGAMPAEERAAAIECLLGKNAKGEPAGRDELAALAQAKLEFVDRVLDLAAEFRMTVFASMVPRDAPQQRNRSFLRKDFSYLFQRIHCHVCDQDHQAHGVMIFDEQDPALSQRLLDQIHRYFLETDNGRHRAERMIPMPFFVHSDLTPAIQIADLVAYICNWGLRMPRMPEAGRDELKPFADKVFAMRYKGREVRKKRTLSRRGNKIWGIAYIPDLRTRLEREDGQDEDVIDLDATEMAA
jgi:Protein of unknown function (DUF3800)